MVVLGEWLGRQPHPAFGEQGNRGLIGDGRARCTSRPPRRHGGFLSRCTRGWPRKFRSRQPPARGPQFFRSELDRGERVVERRHPAAGHQFDLRGAEFELFADRSSDAVGTVGHSHEADGFAARFIAAQSGWAFVDEPEIAMSGSLGDRGLAGVDARPRAGSASITF